MNKIYDILIIGGGPAGLTAAIYAARACLSVAIIEKDYFGGKLTKTVSLENYPGYLENSGLKLAENMHQQTQSHELVEHFDGEILSIEPQKKSKTEGGLWIAKTKTQNFTCKTILIASGTKERKSNIPNEEEYYGNGVSYCAICDGNLYKGKDVVVIGGGNSAAEESIYLSKIVNTVHLIHRRHEFRADKIMMEQIKTIDNIKIYTPFIATYVEVENETVIGVTMKNLETKKEQFLPAKCVFFYIGLLPEIYFLKNLSLKTDDNGFIAVDQNMKTNVKGIFAAGDVIQKNLRQVVTAINDGAIAAISIKNYINEHRFE